MVLYGKIGIVGFSLRSKNIIVYLLACEAGFEFDEFVEGFVVIVKMC